MKTNVARDLFLLSAVAFDNRRYDEAAKLFSACLSSDDSKEFLQSVNVLEIEPVVAKTRSSLSSIARTMAGAMNSDKLKVSLSADEDDVDSLDQGNRDQGEDEDDEAMDDEDDDIYSDEIDPMTPGQRMVLPSLSKVVDSAPAVKSTSKSKWDIQVAQPTSEE